MGTKYENLLEDGSGNFIQSCFDNFEKSQAEFRHKAGFRMTVYRESVGVCCAWCQGLVGVWDYDNRPSNVYERHKNCTCIVYTKTERGTYQDAWSRKEYDNQRDARIAREKEILNEQKVTKADRIEYSAAAGTLPEKMKQYVPPLEERLKIIEQGINAEKPIFCDETDLLYKLARELPEENGFYTVVMHSNSPYNVEFYGQKIDSDTLCAIIAQRKDYKKGTDIRLVVCYSGERDDGVAQYIADKLKVNVKAPDKLGIINKNIYGEYSVYSASDYGKHDGTLRTFKPR